MLGRLFPRIGSGAGSVDGETVVTLVSGLPRSGTSLMMRMLEAGGLEVLFDGIREADVDNPGGYYEYERVKKLREGDRGWLALAEGKVVKVISELLRYLPADRSYRIIFMLRNLDEILASQRRMLAHRGVQDNGDDDKIAGLFRRHLSEVREWLATQSHMRVLDVDYNRLLVDPADQVLRIQRFLGGALDAEAMMSVIDPSLYRQRSEAASRR